MSDYRGVNLQCPCIGSVKNVGFIPFPTNPELIRQWTRQYNTASKTAAAEQVDPDGWRHIGSVEEDVQTLFGFTDPLSGLIHHKDLALCPFCDWETSLALRVKMGEAEQGRFGEGSKKTAFLFVAQGFFRSPNRLDMSDIWR